MLSYFVSVLLGLAVLAGLLVFFHKRTVKDIEEGASVSFDLLTKQDPKLLEDVSEETFKSIYMTAETPTAWKYWLTAIAIFLLGTPLFLGVLNAGVYGMKALGWIIEPNTQADDSFVLNDGEAQLYRRLPGDFVTTLAENYAGFYYFFGLLLFWIAVVYFVLRHYHKNRPGPLHDELLRNK